MRYTTKTEIQAHIDEAFAVHFVKQEYKELLEKLVGAGWRGIESNPSRTVIKHIRYFGFAVEERIQRGRLPRLIITEKGLEYAKRLPLVAPPDDYNRTPSSKSVEENRLAKKVEPKMGGYIKEGY